MSVAPIQPPPENYGGQGFQQPPMAPGYGYQPPTQITNTTVVVQQPAVGEQNLLLVPVHGIREWSTNLFGCFEDLESFLYGWFCPGCLACQISARQGDNFCMTMCVGCDYDGGICATHTSLVAMRARIRTMGGIRGKITSDWTAVCCCPQCALCQMDRELKAMGL